jgi:malonyl CoA-acyl carrier protein transacylase
VIEAWLSAAGVEVVRRDEPKSGSWSRTLWVRVRRAVRGPAAQQVAATLAHAAELKTVTVTDAQVTATLMQSVAQVLVALQNNKDAAIRVGAILVVKVDWVPSVTQLSAAQQFKLDHHLELLNAPAQLLQWLSASETGATVPNNLPRALDP